jgi:hypothetical protein
LQNLSETLTAIGIKSNLQPYSLSSDISFYLIELESKNLVEYWGRIQKSTASFGWHPVVVGVKEELDEILQFTGGESGWFSKQPSEPVLEEFTDELTEPSTEPLTESEADLIERRATWVQFESLNVGEREKWAVDKAAEIDKLEKSPSEIRGMLVENLGKPEDGSNPFGHFLGGLKGEMGTKIQEILNQTSDDDIGRAYQHTLDSMKEMFSFVSGMPESRAALQRLHDFENPNGEPKTLEDAIRLSALLNPEDWFREKCNMESRFQNVKLGAWPKDPYRPKLQFLSDVSDVPVRLSVTLIPARESWDVPCVVRYGGWNACPPAQVHSAVLRRWNKLYGATLVSMTRDTMGLYLRKPISTREEAVKVAREHYIFCNDQVDQGTGFLNDYASQVLDANFWNFWWD